MPRQESFQSHLLVQFSHLRACQRGSRVSHPRTRVGHRADTPRCSSRLHHLSIFRLVTRRHAVSPAVVQLSEAGHPAAALK